MGVAIELSKADLRDLCKKYIKQENQEFQILNYEFKSMSDKPIGFLARHYKLKVKVAMKIENGKDIIEDISFFTKSLPIENESRLQYITEYGVFKKEILSYRDILPKLQNILPNMAPTCYYANSNLIVLENLEHLGFKMAADRGGLLNYEHLKCALKTLAAVHASSIIYEARIGKKLNELYAEALIETSYMAGMPRKQVRVQNFFKVMDVLKEMIRVMPKYKEKLDFILEELPRKAKIAFELAQPSNKYINVINHGDLWANNLLFKYGKLLENPLECRFVDFQNVRFAPPMVDLMLLLIITTTRNFRQLYFDSLLNDYYHFLSEFLKSENLNVAEFLPKQKFEAGIKEFRIFGLIESCVFSHLTVLPTNLTSGFLSSTDGFEEFFHKKRVEICLAGFKTDELYRNRMIDMIEDLIDNFILN